MNHSLSNNEYFLSVTFDNRNLNWINRDVAFKVGPVKVSPVVLNILVILGFVSPHGLSEYSPMIASSSWVNTFLKIIETLSR